MPRRFRYSLKLSVMLFASPVAHHHKDLKWRTHMRYFKMRSWSAPVTSHHSFAYRQKGNSMSFHLVTSLFRIFSANFEEFCLEGKQKYIFRHNFWYNSLQATNRTSPESSECELPGCAKNNSEETRVKLSQTFVEQRCVRAYYSMLSIADRERRSSLTPTVFITLVQRTNETHNKNNHTI